MTVVESVSAAIGVVGLPLLGGMYLLARRDRARHADDPTWFERQADQLATENEFLVAENERLRGRLAGRANDIAPMPGSHRRTR